MRRRSRNPSPPSLPSGVDDGKRKNKNRTLDADEPGGYEIHANGGRPFKVWLSGRTVYVKKAILDDDYELLGFEECLKISKPRKVWVGKDTGCGADGNTLLVKESRSDYVYIGERIHEFDLPDDTIKSYVSPIWGSDVSYGIGFGTHCTYFFSPCNHYKSTTTDYVRRIPNVVLMTKGFRLNDDCTDSEYSALYDYYYEQKQDYFKGDRSVVTAVPVHVIVPEM